MTVADELPPKLGGSRLLALTVPFDGQPVTVLSTGQREALVPVVLVERALDYAPKKLSNAIRRWGAAGLIRPEHVRLIDRSEVSSDLLTRQTSVLNSGTDPDLDLTGRSDLLCLTERGVYRVLMLSRQPKAMAFQDWLETDLLPALARGQLEASRPSLEDRVALQLGRAAIRYARDNHGYDMGRLGTLTRTTVAMIDGQRTTAAQIAKRARMKAPNVHGALWTAAREGIAIAAGDNRLASTATWSLTAANEETAALDAKEVLRISEKATGQDF